MEHAIRIYDVLKSNGHQNLIDEMLSEYGIGGTAGEQFSIVCIWLAKMRNHNNEVYQLIKNDADKILEEGIEIKYFTKDYYSRL